MRAKKKKKECTSFPKLIPNNYDTSGGGDVSLKPKSMSCNVAKRFFFVHYYRKSSYLRQTGDITYIMGQWCIYERGGYGGRIFPVTSILKLFRIPKKYIIFMVLVTCMGFLLEEEGRIVLIIITNAFW